MDNQLEEFEACRICVNCYSLQEMDFINIFHKNEEFQQELNFIQGEIRQWELKIQPDDGLPQHICANCFAKFCSIETFRKECVTAQQRLIDSLMEQTDANNSLGVKKEHNVKQPNSPSSLLSNYESSNVTLGSGANILVSSVNLTQSDVSLNEFSVFDQQFAHFDNPSLLDDSSTLLDSNIIAPETSQELSFLPSQNLFTFETAEPSSTGTLPLVETESTSINNDILEVRNDAINVQKEHAMKQDDLEDMLKHCVIPTTVKLVQKQQQKAKINSALQDIKKEKEQSSLNNSNISKSIKNEAQTFTISFLNREDTISDIECDDSDMNVRLKGSSYACHYCYCPESGSIEHLVFPNEDALSQHFFDIHDPNRPYTCPKCPQSYKSQLLRANHVRLIHKITEIQACNYCKKRLKGSIDVHHYNCQYIGDWECQQCKEKFLNTPLYRFHLHQRQHERTKQFKCRLCECSFIKKANLEAHQNMHKAEVQTAYSCHLCPASFTNDYELKRHKYQQHNGEPPLKCNICFKGFSSNVFLQRHMTQLHEEYLSNSNNTSLSVSSSSSNSSAKSIERQHTCLNCNNSFKSIQKLQNHLLLGRDKNGNCLYSSCNKQERRKLQRAGVYPCFHCPRRFHLRSQLEKHLNTHNARLRPFQCQQCVTRCRTTCELKQHVNVAHLNIKAFACDKCGKCFGYKKDLRDHMLFHSEINVHCTEEGCDYVCKNEKALNDHIRHKHRLLSCEYCNEQFTRQKLTSHLRNIHRSEIDVELALQSDNYYKSQLLNNNNDITQISFNLLNNTQNKKQQQLTSAQNQQLSTSSTPNTLSPKTIESSSLSTDIKNNIKHLTTVANSTVTSLTSCLKTFSVKQKGTNLTSNTTSTSPTITISITNNNNHNEQLCDMFGSDDPNDNTNTTALALHSNDTTNMFLIPSTTTSTISSTTTTYNNNQLDQYFMASLIDTEQEIIVT